MHKVNSAHTGQVQPPATVLPAQGAVLAAFFEKPYRNKNILNPATKDIHTRAKICNTPVQMRYSCLASVTVLRVGPRIIPVAISSTNILIAWIHAYHGSTFAL